LHFLDEPVAFLGNGFGGVLSRVSVEGAHLVARVSGMLHDGSRAQRSHTVGRSSLQR